MCSFGEVNVFIVQYGCRGDILTLSRPIASILLQFKELGHMTHFCSYFTQLSKVRHANY